MSLVPGAVFLSILNPLSGKLADKIGFKPTMLVGMTMIIVGWVAGTLMLSHLSLLGMILCAMIIEGGNAFVMMPAVTLGANALPDELVPHGTAVITTVRQVLGSAGGHDFNSCSYCCNGECHPAGKCKSGCIIAWLSSCIYWNGSS